MSTRDLVLIILISALAGGLITCAVDRPLAPSPTVKAAEADARGKVAVAKAAVTAAEPANAGALRANAAYDVVRKRDTIVVHDVVYVPAAPADAAVQASEKAIPLDTTALAKQDTAIVSEQRVASAYVSEQPSRFGATATALYEPVVKSELVRAGVSFLLTSHLSAIAESEAERSPDDALRARVRLGVRWTFK